MAEGDAGKQKKNKNAPEESQQQQQVASNEKPTLFVILAAINMLFAIGIGVMLFLTRNREAKDFNVDHVIDKGLKGLEEGKDEKGESFINRLVPLETFLVNLSGSRGHKLVKISMDLEVDSGKVIEEIDIRKPLIRDRIITILSSKTYVEISTKEGKEHLRSQIRDQINLSLTHGQVKNVFFTEFIYN